VERKHRIANDDPYNDRPDWRRESRKACAAASVQLPAWVRQRTDVIRYRAYF
jgi:hypothetical protein